MQNNEKNETLSLSDIEVHIRNFGIDDEIYCYVDMEAIKTKVCKESKKAICPSQIRFLPATDGS